MTQTQSYRLSFSRFAPSLSVVSFTATEALNTAYRLDIELTSADADLPLSSYINQAAKFTVTPVSSDALGLIEGMLSPEPLKEWSGIITSCEKLRPLQNPHLRRISALCAARSFAYLHDMSALAVLLRLELHPHLRVLQRSQAVGIGGRDPLPYGIGTAHRRIEASPHFKAVSKPKRARHYCLTCRK